MTKKKLLKFIEEGENLHTEFKQRFSTHQKIAKEMIAFANTRGGIIVFGVDDDGSIYGVLSEKESAELIKETAENYCEPPLEYEISFFEIEGREIVSVEIFESVLKPHRIQDYLSSIDINNSSVYIRVNDKSVLAGKEMIKILQARASNSSLKNYQVGQNERIVFDYLNKNDSINAKTLSSIANISSRRASRTLIKLVRADLLLIHTNDRGEDYFTSAR